MAIRGAPVSITKKKPGFFYGYIVVLAAFFIFMVLDGTMYSFGVFFKPLSAEFGWNRALTSGAFSLFQFLLSFFLMVTGRLNDRFGPRVVMTACAVFLSLGYFLMSRIGAVWQLYLFYGVIAALGMGGGLVPLPSTVARWFVKRRGVMTGITVSGIGVGIIIGPPAATQLITNVGWREAYVVISVVALVSIIVAAQFLRRDPAQKGQVPYGSEESSTAGLHLKSSGFTLSAAMRTRQFWMLAVIYFCASFALMSIMTHMVPHATDVGVPAMVAAALMAVIGGVSIIGRVGIGGACDRIGGRRSLIIAFAVMAVSLLWLLFARNIWGFYLFAVLFGFAYGSKVAVMSPTVAEFFGLKAHGAILGVLVFINGIGGAVGPLMVGWTYDNAGSYFYGFMACAVLSLVGLTQSWLLKPIGVEAEAQAATGPA